jgi:hypothetical protein
MLPGINLHSVCFDFLEHLPNAHALLQPEVFFGLVASYTNRQLADWA